MTTDIQAILETEPETMIAPVHQATIYVIMWYSTRSGGTYSEIRKSWTGMQRFIRTLDAVGFDLSLVTVVEQQKPWIAVKKAKKATRRRDRGELT